MKTMKRVLCVVLVLLMAVACFTGCKKENKSDKKYVQEKGVLVVGITDFAPMDYQDEDGNWIGFDADLAKAFAKKLGVKVKFVEINWKNKVLELNNQTIDVVWNGMTLTDEVKSAMDCSIPYCNNQQIVIVRKEVADKYQTKDSVKKLTFAVEKGSAGQAQVEALGAKFTAVDSQAKALMEVNQGTADAAVIDSLMAGAMVGEGTGFADLAYTVGLNDEQYGIGFRKGSDLVDELNAFLKEYYQSGKMMELAEQYGVQASIIEQK